MNLKRRIKRNEEFKEIIDSRNLIKTKSCNIFFKPTAKQYRFGISVSKKIGNAVTRNLTKRRIRACVREIDEANFKNNYDFIVIAKTSINKMTFEEIRNDISKALLSLFIGD